MSISKKVTNTRLIMIFCSGLCSFEGPLSAEQRERLMEIGDKCPVHQTLSSKIDISTTEQPV